MASFECSEASKVGSGSSDTGADCGASSPLAVVVELRAVAVLPTFPLVAKELLAAADVEYRDGNFGRGCHFSPTGQTCTRPMNQRVRAWVLFFTRG
jgi:hypothetical protein